jgi:hypothetical protein
VNLSVHPSPFSSSQDHFSPFLLSSSAGAPRLVLHRFLPSKPPSVDHGPEEKQAHDTSYEKAQVQALSEIL